MNPLVQSGCLAALFASAMTLPAFATPAWAGSTSLERPASTWESSGSGLKLPQQRLDAGTAIEPHIGMRFSSSANLSHFHSQ